MKAKPVEQLVYEYIFPKPRASDPPNFHAFLERNLIIEVRSEVHAFYGHLDTQEAKYPGLDYCHPIHRVRLGRWPWHRRLFRAFDHLRLTPHEIANLTKWEGTKWAKERYEKEQGITIRDTAGDDIAEWVEPEDRPAATTTTSRRGLSAETEADVNPASDDEEMNEDETEDEDEEREEDEEMVSVGTALNERLRERVARREAGDTTTVLDEEWEQWLKNAIESGEFPFTASQILQQSSTSHPAVFPQALLPTRMLDAARAGQWSEVPEVLHEIIRHSLIHHSEEDATAAAAAAASADMPPLTRAPRRPNDEPQSQSQSQTQTQTQTQSQQTTITITTWRPTYSELRLPGRDTTVHPASELRIHRTAPAPGA